MQLNSTPDNSNLPLSGDSLLNPVRANAHHVLVRRDDPFAIDPFGAAPANAAPAGNGPAFSVRTALRYKWLALAVFALVSLPGVAAVYYFYKPQFDAIATVEVAPSIPRLVYRTDDNGMIPLYREYLNTQVGVIRSPQVLQRVLDLPEVRGTDWFRNPPRSLLGEVESPFDRLRDMLDVAPRGGTLVIDVKTATLKSQDAAILANAVVEQYLAVSRETSKDADEARMQQLNDEYRQARSLIEGLEATVAKLRDDLGTGDPAELLSARRARLDVLVAEAAVLHRASKFATWRLEQLGGDAPSPAEADAPPSDVAADAPPAEPEDAEWKYAADADWRKAHLDLETARHRLAVEGGRLGESHPKMVEMRQDVTLAEKLLRARERTLDHVWATPGGSGGVPGTPGTISTPAAERSNLARTIAELKYQEELIRADIVRSESEVEHTSEIVRLLAKETDTLRYQRDRYEAVRARKTEREIESRMPGSIRVQSHAVAASSPSNAKRRVMFFGLVTAFGAFLGLGAAYVRTVTNRALLDAADVTQPAHTAFLGHVPNVRDPERPTPQEEALLSERIRIVRTALLERIDPRRGQAVLLSSAGPRVGKTTLAFQLGRSLAQCGLRVLLVDADLRNCAVSRRSGAEGRRGLIDLLAYGATESDTIVGTDQPGLQILPAGRLPDRALVEVLADPAFDTRLRSWRERFNVILLDSPPVLPVADAAILARVADGTVIVAREGHCRRPDVLESIARLSTCGAKLLGLVYIGARDARASGYHASGYYLPTGNTAAMDAREGVGV